MRPRRLIISGWGPYKDKEEIDFTQFDGRGVFLITGATGAGKTTLFDAITYALYGDLSGELREKNSVRSDFANADTPTFVELFMVHGGKEYHIVRNPEYMRPRRRGGAGALTKEKETAILYLPEGKVLQGTKEVNARIQELLALDYAQFKQITMIAQGEFMRLLQASPKDKTKILRDIFDTGIYERFSQNLRTRSNQLYAKVMEQKNKLEEDIRLLLSGSRVEETENLRTLTDSDNWNYDAIKEELHRILEKARESETAWEQEYRACQEKMEALTGEVTAKKIENDQIEQLETASRQLEQLLERTEEMAEKTEVLKRARAAAALGAERQRAKSLRDSLLNALERQRAGEETVKGLQKEQEELAFFAREKDTLQRYLEACRILAESGEQTAKLERDFATATDRWDQDKAIFLEKEQEKQLAQEQYDGAEQRYRYAVVGVAARLLTEGKPCPVCGSLEHPHPAETEEGIPSDEELKTLKEKSKRTEEALFAAQEKAAGSRSSMQELQSQLEAEKSRLKNARGAAEELENTLREKKSPLETDFFRDEYTGKVRFIQKRAERLTQLEGQLVEGRRQLVLLEQEIADHRESCEKQELRLQELLVSQGFSAEEDCQRAALPERELEELAEEIRVYGEQISAAESVKTHLEATLQNKKKQDLVPLQEQLEASKERFLQAQEGQKQAHAFGREVEKTYARYKEKQQGIAAAREEYGYVKDLDNLAYGNNPKRLVFEQYVLAGYFEEILRAANLRFSKMTGARYEMSRVEEAGDGRVKDSLDIQVMDFYTGKTRSVKTLSGGECFKASLSLALGMSDVIQAANGGIQVDTLFIDEGFGALDQESLDQACEALMGLAMNRRLIGIISHVAELRERIDSQIVVEKTNSGSRVKIRV